MPAAKLSHCSAVASIACNASKGCHWIYSSKGTAVARTSTRIVDIYSLLQALYANIQALCMAGKSGDCRPFSGPNFGAQLRNGRGYLAVEGNEEDANLSMGTRLKGLLIPLSPNIARDTVFVLDGSNNIPIPRSPSDWRWLLDVASLRVE